MKRASLTMALIAGIAGVAGMAAVDSGSRFHRDPVEPPPQSPTRRAEKIAAAEAKRKRKAERRRERGQ